MTNEVAGFIVTSVFFVFTNLLMAGTFIKRPERITIIPMTVEVDV
ncbi:MAG: hypothetical protein WKG06_36705 [Segetibacter sp.]